MVALLHEPPFGEVHGDLDATWLLTCRPEPFSNGVLHAELDPRDPDATIERLLEPFRSLGFGQDAPFHHVVCRAGDEAIGPATLSTVAEVACLGNIAVVPDWRRRGVGAAVASAALDEGRALGLEVAGLSSDPLGVGLYRTLGFAEASQHLPYVWRPER